MTSKIEVTRIEKVHSDIVEFLRQVDSDFHEIPARNLALRVENNILQPVRYAMTVIDAIEDIGIEFIPEVILNKWNYTIIEALKIGGVDFE